MKKISEESEMNLVKALQALGFVEVKGRENHVHMVNAMDAIQEILKQVNTPEEKGKEASKK